MLHQVCFLCLLCMYMILSLPAVDEVIELVLLKTITRSLEHAAWQSSEGATPFKDKQCRCKQKCWSDGGTATEKQCIWVSCGRATELATFSICFQ